MGGLSVLSRVQRWAWLGISALVGGLGWGAVLLAQGALEAAPALSIGFYLLLIGIAFPLLALPGATGRIVRIAGSIAAAAQMAALVASGGFALLHWGLFGLLSVAVLWLAAREDDFQRLPVVGLAIGLLLLGAWTDPAPSSFALVMIATALIYGAPALLALWRSRRGIVEAGQIAAIALAAPLIAAMHYYRADHSADLALALVALASAPFPAAAALLGWNRPQRRDDPRFAALATAAALLLGLAAGFAAPTWLLPLLVAAIAVGLQGLSLEAGDERLQWSASTFAAAALACLAAARQFLPEAERLFGLAQEEVSALALLRWAGLALAAAFFAWRARLEAGRAAAQAAAALLGYGAAAQLVPETLLPPLVAAALLAVALAGRLVAPRVLLPALAVLLGASALWAGIPLIRWLAAAMMSAGGDPMLVGELPAVRDALLRLLLPAALIAAAVRQGGRSAEKEERKTALAFAGLFAAVGIHILFKQLFALDSAAEFAALGLAERTVWEAALAAAGLAAWRLGWRNSSLALCGAAMAHWLGYSFFLHNPLWSGQSVGSLPFLNLLLPSYGLALGLLWAAQRTLSGVPAEWRRGGELLRMLLIVLLSFSLLRQIAEGSILSGARLLPAEDIARSILAIALAIGFLLWGIARGGRDWRIASLLLMLGSVAKVFLLDASGLEGLTRIGSFVALGISLIAIGWLYSRALGSGRRGPEGEHALGGA